MLKINKSIHNSPKGPQHNAQTVVEYMMLLASVVAIVLIGMKQYYPVVFNSSDIYYNRVVLGVLGEGPSCGDTQCMNIAGENCETCAPDCGACPVCGVNVNAYISKYCPRDCGLCPDCSPCCGDEICNGTEDSASCPLDCVPTCGDGDCDTSTTGCPNDVFCEDCINCPGDCPTCPYLASWVDPSAVPEQVYACNFPAGTPHCKHQDFCNPPGPGVSFCRNDYVSNETASFWPNGYSQDPVTITCIVTTAPAC